MTVDQMNQPIDPKLVERIRKTLSLAQCGGATEAEAAAATEMAQKLMRKYNITLAEVEAAGSAGAEGSRRTRQTANGRAQYAFQRELMQVCAEVNFCAVFNRVEWRGRSSRVVGFSLIGREANVISATNLFDYLMTTVERLAFEFVGKDNKKRLSRKATSFKEGCAERLGFRLRQRHEQALEEQAEEARKQNAAAPQSNGMALAVILTDFAQEERDRNEDFRRGLPEGTTATERKRREVREMRARSLYVVALAAIRRCESEDLDAMSGAGEGAIHIQAEKLGLDRQEQHISNLCRRVLREAMETVLEEREAKERLAKETPKQRKARLEKERKQLERWYKQQDREERSKWDRRDVGAYRSGSEAGSRVGLDKQVDSGTKNPRGLLS